MPTKDRAAMYAVLFTAVGAAWRRCVPVDGRPHRSLDRMELDGFVIERPDRSTEWGVTA